MALALLAVDDTGLKEGRGMFIGSGDVEKSKKDCLFNFPPFFEDLLFELLFVDLFLFLPPPFFGFYIYIYMQDRD